MATDHPCPSSPRVRSSGTTTSSKKTSENSGAPCMVSIGPHLDARAVHVDEEGGDAPVGRLRGPGAGQEDAALGVLGQAGPDLLARDPPHVAVPGGPAGQRGQVAAGPRLGEPLAPGLVAASSRGTITAASSGVA